MYNKVLVPLALDHGFSEKTLTIARKFCNEGGQVTAIHVYDIPRGTVAAYMGDEYVQKGFEAAYRVLRERVKGFDGVKADIVRGHANRAIVDYAKKGGFDCIVIGSHRPDGSEFLIGSTAARVVRHAPCTVHVHRG